MVDGARLNLFKPVYPVNGIDAISQGAAAKKTQPANGEAGGGLLGALNRMNFELTPDVGEKGLSHTNGLGYSQHTKNWMF